MHRTEQTGDSASGLACAGLVRAPWFRCPRLRVPRGRVTVLRGPTGSGKSLLLRTLADLDPADAGEVELDGRSRESWSGPAWRRRVLYVHPGGVRTQGTVAEDLARVAGLAASGGRRLEPWHLDPYQDVGRLSAGEAQLLALSRALGLEPDVLLLDESTAALDPVRAAEAEERVAAFARAGGAVLWVAHDAQLAARLGATELAWSDVTENPGVGP